MDANAMIQAISFLSTLSLRRATRHYLEGLYQMLISIHALLAESDTSLVVIGTNCVISIHALLAESDSTFRKPSGFRAISIHALLAESDFCLLVY